MLVQQSLSGYVNTKDPQFDLLPLRHAVTVSKPHYVKVLLSQGAKADAADVEGPVVNQACESKAPERQVATSKCVCRVIDVVDMCMCGSCACTYPCLQLPLCYVLTA